MTGTRARALPHLGWLVAAAWAVGSAGCGGRAERVVSAGFSFEPISFSSAVIGGPLTPSHLAAIERTARAELEHAFAGLRVSVSDRSDTRFHVAVRQQIRDVRTPSMFVAGESRAVRGLGGRGAVNFSLLASAALSCAPNGAVVDVLLEAIGRGIGRAAAHEFAHQFLPSAPIHATKDRASYEYATASRCEQYFGPMHWDLAGPLLHERLGVSPQLAGTPGVDARRMRQRSTSR